MEVTRMPRALAGARSKADALAPEPSLSTPTPRGQETDRVSLHLRGTHLPRVVSFPASYMSPLTDHATCNTDEHDRGGGGFQ